MKHSNLFAILTLSLSLTACQEFIQQAPSEFYPAAILGIDANCSEGVDVASCEAIPGCQPAYGENPEGGLGGFEGCVADPDYFPDDSASASGGSTSGSTDGSASGGSSSGGSYSSGGSSDGSASGGSSSSGGSYSSGGSSSGSTDGSASGGSSSGAGGDEPSLDDVQPNCHGVDAQYLYVKRIIEQKKRQKIIAKVKVCHETAKSRHTIVIACPAVKAHVDHHDDKLGACK